MTERDHVSFHLVSDDVASIDQMAEATPQPASDAQTDRTKSNESARNAQSPSAKKRHYEQPQFWSCKAIFHLVSPLIMLFGGALVGLFVIIFVCACLVMANPNNKCASFYDALNRVLRGGKVVQKNVTDFAFLFPIYLFGEHERQIGHIPQAIKADELIQRLDPEYKPGSILTDQGNCYLTVGDSQMALNSFNRAIALEPKSWRAYYSRGHLYQLQKNFPAALSDYSTAIKLGSYRAYFRRVELSKALQLDELAAQDQEQIARYSLEDVPGTTCKLIGLSTSTHRK